MLVNKICLFQAKFASFEQNLLSNSTICFFEKNDVLKEIWLFLSQICFKTLNTCHSSFKHVSQLAGFDCFSLVLAQIGISSFNFQISFFIGRRNTANLLVPFLQRNMVNFESFCKNLELCEQNNNVFGSS